MPSRLSLAVSLLGATLALVLLSFPASAALWSAHEMVGPNDAYDDGYAEIVVLPDGRPLVVWMGSGGVFYCIRDPLAGWGPRQPLYPDDPQSDRWPRLAMAADGTPWVAWLRLRSGGMSEYDLLVTRMAGGVWAPAETAASAPDVNSGTYFGLAPVDSGSCWVVFNQIYGVYARKLEGGTWGTKETVSGFLSGHQAWHVDTATCQDGQPWAAWTDEETRCVNTSRRAPDGVWPEPVNAFGALQDVWFVPSITVDESDEAWVSASTYAPDSCGWHDVYYARTLSHLWQPPGVVNDVTSGCVSDAAPDFDASYGFPPRCVWIQKDPPDGTAAYLEPFSSSWDSQAWNPQVPTHTPEPYGGTDSYPSIALGPNGEAWATWRRAEPGSGEETDIFASSLLVDVIEYQVAAFEGSVTTSWQVVGVAPRENYRYEIWRSSESGEAARIARIPGAGDEHSVTDSAVDPGARYRYWITVHDRDGAPVLFSTNVREITLQSVAVQEGPPGVPEPTLEIVPSPSEGAFLVSMAGIEAPVLLEIFDVAGRRVLTQTFSSEGRAAPRQAISGSRHLAAGSYYARARSPKGGPSATKKFLVVR